MNSTVEKMLAHRSIRRFTDKPIPDDLFANLIAAGQAASTSSFIQAVSVIRIQDDALREQFVSLSGGQKYISQTAEFLVFCADLQRNAARVQGVQEHAADFSWTEQFLASTVDVALFAQNVVIAAESEQLGCCYIGGIRNDPEKVSQLLELPELVYPVFGLCIGYPQQDPDIKPRLPSEAVLHSERYRMSQSKAELIDRYDAQVRDYYRQRTSGKLSVSWSEQMAKQAATQSRPFMMEFLKNQGFMKK